MSGLMRQDVRCDGVRADGYQVDFPFASPLQQLHRRRRDVGGEVLL